MRSDRHHDRAFVIQLGPGADPAAGRFEGRIEHVASGASARFARADECLAFIARVFSENVRPADEGDA